MNVLLLGQKYDEFTGGYYHQDWVNSFFRKTNCFIYGPGFPNYSPNHTISDVYRSLRIEEDYLDLIVATTTWDRPGQKVNEDDVNIHPNIDLSKAKPKTVYFLNKEYLNLEAKLRFAIQNKFDLVVTVLPKRKHDYWARSTGLRFEQLRFAVDFERLRGDPFNKKWDFCFSGALHDSYTDQRRIVKEKIFKAGRLRPMIPINELSNFIFPSYDLRFLSYRHYLPANLGLPRLLHPTNPLIRDLENFKIYWAERHRISKNFLLQDLLPFKDRYFELLAASKTSLCTLSAEDIMGPRFFELMASRAIVLCPEADYEGIMSDGENCVMYHPDGSNFVESLQRLLEDDDRQNRICNQAMNDVKEHSYDSRVSQLINYVHHG